MIAYLKQKKYLLKRVDFWLYAAVLFCATFFFFYQDQVDTVTHSVFFWHSILHGNLTGGYQAYIDAIFSDIPHGVDTPGIYEPLAYIIVGILSMPLVILNELGKLNFASRWMCLYVKAQQLLLFFGCAYLIYKIQNEIEKDLKKAEYAAFLFLTNLGVLYFAIVVGQIEIYAVYFCLCGIYYWVKDDYKKFIFFFAISIPLKMFSLLIFIPLVLIKQKNVWKVIGSAISGCAFLLVGKVVWSTNDAYRILTAEPKERVILALQGNTLPGGVGTDGIPIFICIYILICVWVYLSQRKDALWGIYISFAVYAALFLFVGQYPYWIVVITSFFPLLIANKAANRKINLILELLFWVFYILASCFYHTWIASASIVEKMALPKLFGANTNIKYYYVSDFLNAYGVGKLAPLFVGIYAAALIALVILNYPGERVFAKVVGISDGVLNRIRILSIVPFMILLVFTYYQKGGETLIDTSNGETYECGWNLLSDEVVAYGDDALVQPVQFDVNEKLDEMKLFFTTSGNSYQVCSSLYVEFKDLENGEVLYSKRMGYNQIPWGNYSVFKLADLNVKKEHLYAITVKVDKPNPNFQVHLKVTPETKLGNNMEYLGREVQGNFDVIFTGSNLDE